MASLNEVKLIGNLGRDPEVSYTQNNEMVTRLSIATTDVWKDKNTGDCQKRTEWHRVVLFGRLAEIASQYLEKGSQVYISGKLRTSKYQDKQTGQDRYSTDIRADDLKMLGSRQQEQLNQTGYNQTTAPDFSNDDIPF